MTSNLGTKDIAKNIGFSNLSEIDNYEKMKSKVGEELKRYFRPEFLNRIDETIIFDSLSVEELSNIAEIVTSKFIARVNDLGISMKITKNGINWLVENGFDKAYGARPLKRVVQRSLENEFAKKLLSGEFQDGDSVVVTSKNNKLVINKSNSKK